MRPLDLRLRDYDVNDACVAYRQDNTTFAFTIAPLADVTIAILEQMADKHGTVWLYCSHRPLRFDLTAVERQGPSKARLVGRVVR